MLNFFATASAALAGLRIEEFTFKCSTLALPALASVILHIRVSSIGSGC